jgi:hypothetical protein
MDDPEIPRAPRRGWSIERYSAVFAVLVSLTTLVLSIAQTRLMQTQARASAWPHVSIGFSANQTGFAWVVANNGVGPQRPKYQCQSGRLATIRHGNHTCGKHPRFVRDHEDASR